MYKVMTILGTRPELIKMSRVIPRLDENFNHILVHTGQNYDYELNEVFFNDLSIRKPDYFLGVSSESLGATIGNIISKSEVIMDKEKPDAILVYGDTNSCLSAMSAKRKKIPIFHMEAGNRSFDQNVPEETNRKILDHISDVNLVLTEHARRNLISEGVASDRIFKTGSHMVEVLDFYSQQIENSTILSILNIQEKKYFLTSIHREENVDNQNNLTDILESLNSIAQTYKLPIIVSTHPRTEKKMKEFGFKDSNNLIRFNKPFGFFDYIKLQKNAFCVISDSGTITEESSLLNIPAITIRDSHERPEGMDSAILIMSGLKKEQVLDAIKITTENLPKNSIARKINDYLNPDVSSQIIKILFSYIPYVNKRVWMK
jgi:UDP-N-acetylglucosamine 2-epimerase (non-hydrolysing)